MNAQGDIRSTEILPGASDARQAKKSRRCKIIACMLLLLAAIAAVVVVVVLKLENGGDAPSPGPEPGPDKPITGYNPYVIDNSTIQEDFGEYSG